MSLVTEYPFPFNDGSSFLGVSTDVPNTWPVSLNGRNYVLDIATDRWRHTSIQMLRAQADQSTTPSEASLNPEGLWRRAQDSFHHGAGQDYRDRPGSDEQRFNASKGIDVWTPYEFSLLQDTDQKVSSANTNLYLTTAGARIYYTDNQTVKFTTDITPGTPTFTTVTGTPGATVAGICSDGFNVYVAYSASGIYSTNTGSSVAASYATGTVTGVIDYVKGRLLVTNASSIYNVIVGGGAALPTALYTHANTDFDWVGFAPGPTAIYAAGFSGDKSLIYRIGITTDATTLDAPVVAGELPDGEIVRAIEGYLGFILLGTDKGARLCSIDATGNLIIGSLIKTASGVRCFEGQDRFVWFGWSNYDALSTGLGRMDLTAFTESLETGAKVPAYASDLMVTGQGTIVSAATFNNLTVFTVSGLGVYAEWTDLVASGTLDSGFITFGLPDTKTGVLFDVRTKPLTGSYVASVATDDGTFSSLGVQSAVDSTGEEFPMDYATGELFEARIALTRDAVTTTGPIVTRYTMKAAQGAIDGPAEYIVLPLMFHRVLDVNGREEFCDVQLERQIIKDLRRSHVRVVCQEAEDSYDVFVEAYEWIPYEWSTVANGGFGTPDGTMVVQLKRIN